MSAFVTCDWYSLDRLGGFGAAALGSGSPCDGMAIQRTIMSYLGLRRIETELWLG